MAIPLIPGYSISTILHNSSKTRVYRAERDQDGQAVVLKVLKPDQDGGLYDCHRYEQEYEILKSLNLEGVVKAYDLISHRRLPILILEDYGGLSLSQWYLQQPTHSWTTCLRIAEEIALIVADVHRCGVIHKDLNPANILIHPETGQLKLIDFGISSRFRREQPNLTPPQSLEGTLPYCSPEQTGRMNRVLDSRSDLYSLGVLFYELCTGTLPFEHPDPLELVHCHIAQPPPTPEAPGFPPLVAQIILKLLAKNAEDRYQTARGLAEDLRRCRQAYEQHQSIDPFPLGSTDRCDRLQIPEKLYGRDLELHRLQQAFDHSLGDQRNPDITAAASLLLVTGPSGMGKSRLVQEIYAPITAARGYFARGKFDQLQRAIPYAGLTQALSDLVDHLLLEGDDQVQIWRDKLKTALGHNAQIAVKLVPNLAFILGEVTSVPELPASQSLERFNFVIENLLRVFSQPEHPLILFLDDVQWADADSLKLLQRVLLNEQGFAFLPIVAYRNDEVSRTHPLALVLDHLEQAGVVIEQLELQPLDLKAVTELIAAALEQTLEQVSPLAQVIERKTSGNPFFITTLLTTLYEDGIIRFNDRHDDRATVNPWCWDLAEVDQHLADNLVDLVIANFRKLPPETQQLLQFAACVGNDFNLDRLSSLTQDSVAVIIQTLLPAIEAGFVIVDTQSQREGRVNPYHFAHDRLQEAAYVSMEANRRIKTHWQIGQILLSELACGNSQATYFEIADHLNLGLPQVDDPSDFTQVSRCNILAARQARSAAAYPAAANYLAVAREMEGDELWQQDYSFALTLYRNSVEAEYLCSHYDQAAQLAQQVHQQAQTVLDRVPVWEIEIQFHSVQNQMQQAIALGQAALDHLGITVLDEAPDLGEIEQWDALPQLRDATAQAALRIALVLFSPMCISSPERLAPLNWTMLDLCWRHGNCAEGAFAYAFCGLLLGTQTLDIQRGYAFGDLAQQVLDRYPNPAVDCKVLELFHAFIHHWQRPLKFALTGLRETIQIGLQTGDLEFTGYAILHYGSNLLLSGEPLSRVEAEQRDLIALLRRFNQTFSLAYASLWTQMTLNLQGHNANPRDLAGELFDAAPQQAQWEEDKTHGGLYSLHLVQGMLLYLLRGDGMAALTALEQARPYLNAMAGLLPALELPFYEALAALRVYPDASEAQQQLLWTRILEQRDSLERWAEASPSTFAHKRDLVVAEIARLSGDILTAEVAYEQAIEGAALGEFLHEEALAWELAGDFYRGRGRTRIAQAYLQSAYDTYRRWQATAKLAQLEADYPLDWFTSHGSKTATQTTRLTSSGSQSGALDLTAVVKAAQAIAQEIELDRLLATLMRTVLTSAGAQWGALVLPPGKTRPNWTIAVEGRLSDEQEPEQVQVEERPLTGTLATSIVYYVARTQKPVVLMDARSEGRFAQDPYLLSQQPRSLLCYPLRHQNELIGVVYLENNLTPGAFTVERIELLQLLSGQAAIALTNAQLYQEIRNSEQQLKQFLGAMPVGVFVVDAQGQPYYANQTAERLLGKGIVAKSRPEDLAQIYHAYRASDGNPYPSEALPLMRALGGDCSAIDDLEVDNGQRRVPLEVWGTPIFDGKGEVLYGLTAFQDISDRRQAEADRRAFADHLSALNQAHARFVPQQFLQLLNKQSILDVDLGDRLQREMSVLFADIRKFTTRSEQLSPKETFAFLNHFLSQISPVIQDHQGFIDKYLGDGIMALFSGGADSAVQGAIAILQQLARFNQENPQIQPIELGIGIHTGPLMLGIVGETNRLDGTAIGDTVNLAARLEQLTKDYGAPLLISQQTVEGLAHPQAYRLRRLGAVTVRGKSRRTTLYEVFDGDSEALRQQKQKTLATFTQAVQAYEQQQWTEAIAGFEVCLTSCPEDSVARRYCDRARLAQQQASKPQKLPIL